MAVRTTEELLASINDRFAESTDDETLAFIEDVTDTMNDLTSKAGDQTDWKTKYEENDASWRKKYKDRFFTNGSGDDDDNQIDDIDEPDDRPKTFEDLFKIGE
nr:MAG TPA: hypothetical protein [Caudoviricetes sp.]